eukprot:gene11857-biopygen5345
MSQLAAELAVADLVSPALAVVPLSPRGDGTPNQGDPPHDSPLHRRESRRRDSYSVEPSPSVSAVPACYSSTVAPAGDAVDDDLLDSQLAAQGVVLPAAVWSGDGSEAADRRCPGCKRYHIDGKRGPTDWLPCDQCHVYWHLQCFHYHGESSLVCPSCRSQSFAPKHEPELSVQLGKKRSQDASLIGPVMLPGPTVAGTSSNGNATAATARQRVFCPIPGCLKGDPVNASGWGSHIAMRDHLQ